MAFIRCFEAPMSYALHIQSKGKRANQGKWKTKIVNKGLRPEGSEDLPFALDILMTFEDTAGVFGAKTLSYLQWHFKEGERINKEHGQRLVAWCYQGKTPKQSQSRFSEDETNK